MILSTSDEARRRIGCMRTGYGYLWIAIGTAVFGAVYEWFGHGVYSYYMLYAFGFPLVGGALPFFSLALGEGWKRPGSAACRLYHSGVATLTVGSVMTGVFEIYGAANRLVQIYWYVGIGLVLLGLMVYAAANPGKA